MRAQDQKGQALIETILTSGATFLSFSLILMISYRGLVYFAARHSVNDLLLCMSSIKTQNICEFDFRKKTTSFLLFKESSSLKIEKNEKEILISFQVQAPGTPAMLLERKLLLPMERNL